MLLWCVRVSSFLSECGKALTFFSVIVFEQISVRNFSSLFLFLTEDILYSFHITKELHFS